MTKTKQTAHTMNQTIGCQVMYRGDNGTVVSVSKESGEWMMRIAMDHGGVAILRPSEIR